MRKLFTSAIVALGLTMVPVAHAAAPARASAPVAGANSAFGGDATEPLIMALVIAAATIYLLIEQDDDDDPDSP